MNRNIVKFYAILFIMLSSVVLITDCCSSRSMPKSRPRPSPHFRGLITTSSAKITATSGNGDSTTFTLITTKTTSTISEAQSETTSTVTDPRSGPGPGPGGGGTDTASGAGGIAGDNPAGATSKDQLMRMGRCTQLFEENYCLNGGKCYNFTIANSTMPTCECADGFMGERCESKYLDGTYLSMRKSKIHIETASICYGAFLAVIVALLLLYLVHCFQTTSSGGGSRLFRRSKKVVS